jgi:hypothetical protein
MIHRPLKRLTMQKDLDDRGQDSRGSVVVLLVVKLASFSSDPR